MLILDLLLGLVCSVGVLAFFGFLTVLVLKTPETRRLRVKEERLRAEFAEAQLAECIFAIRRVEETARDFSDMPGRSLADLVAIEIDAHYERMNTLKQQANTKRNQS